jgi:hypothetical protein
MTHARPDGEYERLRIDRPYLLPEPVGLVPVRRRAARRTAGAGRAWLALSTGIVVVLATVAAVAASGDQTNRAEAGTPQPSVLSDPDGGFIDPGEPIAAETPILTPTGSVQASPDALSNWSNPPGQEPMSPVRPQPSSSAGNPGTVPAQQPIPGPTAVQPTTQPPPPPPPPPTTAPTGRALVSAESGKCLRANPSDGSPVQLWGCDGSAAQQWNVMSDGTIRTGGLCMDAAWGATASGTRVQVARCSGNPAQQFNLNSAYDLVNVQADKCVDVVDHLTANGTPIQIWTCRGQSNQKWTLR